MVGKTVMELYIFGGWLFTEFDSRVFGGGMVVVVVVVVVFRMPGVGCPPRSERPKDGIRLNARWAWKRCPCGPLDGSFPSTSCFRCVLKALIAVEFQAGEALRWAICNMEPTADERLTRRPKGSGANRA
ncbi:hypothetical protein QR685DRAFT_529696 [Neurospora intermedia]|uniref:Uncharacterized protein n=1 Tax=Neurospora intermedia TaxID=5142 RepID=A0ABR3D8R9_NEUIN